MRRRRAVKRQILPDPKYNSRIVAKMINILMIKGKKSTAETIVYGAFDIIKAKTGEEDPVKVFNKALENIRPRWRLNLAAWEALPIRSHRGIPGTWYIACLRWIKDFSRAKKGKPMPERLADEIMAGFKGEGAAIKKRDDTHKMAEANKAFAHFRW
jgi:small subunit ribosomal protein S7